MFHQLLTPVGNSLWLSSVTAALPALSVVLLLGLFRRPAWQAASAGLAVGAAVALGPWQVPLNLVMQSVLSGAVFALWPVMWIVLNGLLLFNIAVCSGRFDAFRRWMLSNLPNDRRIVLVVIGFCFGALLEGVAGFGCPVAITSSLLIPVGFPALEALVFALIFNTTPVAFGGLGIPVTVLGAVTDLPAPTLAAMIGRQLPVISVVLPFYVMALYGGWRSVRALWPVLLVAGASFGITQFFASNFMSYTLTDVLSALTSLFVTLLFVRVWRVVPEPKYMTNVVDSSEAGSRVPAWQGWLPWLVVAATVIAWTSLKLSTLGQLSIPWPGLHNAIAITLYRDKPYAAIWTFQPLATGTAVLVASLITCLLFRVSPATFVGCVAQTLRQTWLAVITVMLIVGLAYLMNYSGLAYTLGLGAASTRHLFIVLSPFLGWMAVALSGSDTSGNALFGNLQVVAAKQLNFDPVLLAATNSSGGVMGKMISPQNIATGAAVTHLKGQEGKIFARTFVHSVVLTLLLAALVLAQQYLVPEVIPRAISLP
jgi:lactate permease